MFTIIVLLFVVAISLVIGCIFTAEKEYKEALTCFAILALSVLLIIDIFNFVNEARDRLRTQAIEYNYAKYEVDSKGSITFSWIVPTPPPKVEPAKPAPVKPEPVVVEKN